ncbi:hypothetical protein Ddye_000318 [Dipteronia dyeriana]|uniref:DDE Tnp4 domain-containing protein n=1 Tax=Dipteronia dyeriana TaxID=168575 RepID=A0AAD9XLH3_9ROSI|nr:hypothetical protein Ddye_000318 [Dipteronia dyeriana]
MLSTSEEIEVKEKEIEGEEVEDVYKHLDFRIALELLMVHIFHIDNRTRYFSGYGRALENEHELFNLRHSFLRNVIERIFGIFKSRFTIFKNASPFIYRTQSELVLACTGLHNFLYRKCRSDEFPIEPDNKSLSLRTNEDEFKPIFQTQEEQRDISNRWRASIAMNMWEDAMQNESNDNEAE